MPSSPQATDPRPTTVQAWVVDFHDPKHIATMLRYALSLPIPIGVIQLIPGGSNKPGSTKMTRSPTSNAFADKAHSSPSSSIPPQTRPRSRLNPPRTHAHLPRTPKHLLAHRLLPKTKMGNRAADKRTGPLGHRRRSSSEGSIR